MAELSERIAALPPEKRAILERRLFGARAAGGDQRPELAGTAISRQPRPGRLPLSYGQQRIWFLDQLEGSTAEYILSQALRVEGELDRAALEKAVQALVDRHESLRTRFDDIEGEPFQVIETGVRLSLPIVDLTNLEESTREEAISDALDRASQEPFDLRTGPPIRTRLFKLGDRRHILFVAFHHIVSDGWSISVFNQELATLYDAFCKGLGNPLGALPLQYPDYAVWQRSHLQGEELENLISYWRTRLADIPSLRLPNDRPRPDHQHFAAEAQRIILPRSLGDSLGSLAHGEGATVAMVLLAVFKLLLHRLAEQDEIAVGTPVAGRNRSETEGLIGFFVNTVVLCTNLSDDLSFRQLLHRVRTTALEAYAHQEAPFEKLVEILNPERNLNRHPLFEVFYNYVNLVQVSQIRLFGLSTEAVQIEHVLGKFPMSLYVRDQPEGIELKLVYQSALFSHERIRHFMDQLEHLVRQVVEDPDRQIQTYSLVTAKARPLLPDPTIRLSEPAQSPISNLFLSNAKLHPDRIAIRHQGREWTYRELAGSAQEIATQLSARGVEPGDVVAISGQRSLGLISGMLGIMLARGVLLTLDSSLPVRRLSFMVRAASSKHWLAVDGPNGINEDASEEFQALSITRVTTEGCCRDPIFKTENNLREVRPDDPAYVFFTSGTTGTPKGILGTHKGLSHFLRWEQQLLSIGANDRVAQLTGLSFDVVLRDIFLPLTAGATLCLPEAALLPHGGEVIPWMRRERITVAHSVPSLAAAWLDTLDSPAGLPDLRWVLFAGEPLTSTLVARWRASMGETHNLVNLYGPTETTLAKCCYRVPSDPAPGVQAIGKPLPDTQGLVMNRAGQLCGIGEPGEIVIRTPFRTLGYLATTQENQARFVPNPFGGDAQDIVYRTGDRGTYGNEGHLHISGRLDDQVKIRGNRVEPAEVAAALAQHRELQECAVLPRQNAEGDWTLVAYLVRNPKLTDIGVVALRDFLKQRLPDYMLPVGFVILPELPLTSNGKLDRKALASLEATPLQTGKEYVASRDPIERSLSLLWGNLLRLDQVGVRDDFFELGGHSLIATRLVSQVRKEFGVEIPLRTIFESTTIERLAVYIAEKQTASITSEEVEQLLQHLEDLPEEAAEAQVTETEHVGRDLPKPEPGAPGLSPFACPTTRSKIFGTRQCNLVIIINERFERKSFEELAGYVREFDPSISTLVTRDRATMEISIPSNPTLIFSPALIRHQPPVKGRTFCGYPFSKSEEYLALEKAGVPVPKWALLTEDHLPDLSEFDDFVVKKPDHGWRGAEVKIMRKNRVKWKPVMTRSAGDASSFIIQRFIYTGPRPVCYRLNTLFGKVLYSKKYEVRDDRPAWAGPDDKEFSGRSIIASSPNSKVEASYDEEVIRLGEWAHSAFPEIPLLGFDIVREVPSGKLFVLEANAIGCLWNFYTGQETSYGFSSERQFDGIRKGAYILAEKTQEYAE